MTLNPKKLWCKFKAVQDERQYAEHRAELARLEVIKIKKAARKLIEEINYRCQIFGFDINIAEAIELRQRANRFIRPFHDNTDSIASLRLSVESLNPYEQGCWLLGDEVMMSAKMFDGVLSPLTLARWLNPSFDTEQITMVVVNRTEGVWMFTGNVVSALRCEDLTPVTNGQLNRDDGIHKIIALVEQFTGQTLAIEPLMIDQEITLELEDGQWKTRYRETANT